MLKSRGSINCRPSRGRGRQTWSSDAAGSSNATRTWRPAPGARGGSGAGSCSSPWQTPVLVAKPALGLTQGGEAQPQRSDRSSLLQSCHTAAGAGAGKGFRSTRAGNRIWCDGPSGSSQRVPCPAALLRSDCLRARCSSLL